MKTDMTEPNLNFYPDSDVKEWRVQIYVQHGYFEYSVKNKEKAMAHAQAIANSKVYRRVTEDAAVEFHTPYKVKVVGPDLGSAYMDTFHRT